MEHWHEMISGFAENVQPFFMIPSARADRLNKTMLLTICSMKNLVLINLNLLNACDTQDGPRMERLYKASDIVRYK